MWTPADSGVRPQLVQTDGRVQLFLISAGRPGPGAVWIQLSSALRWALEFSGGATQTVLNLRDGKLGSIDFTAGSSLATWAVCGIELGAASGSTISAGRQVARRAESLKCSISSVLTATSRSSF